ncbi:hypothetical protein D3C80_1943130 [compost metagenome]
MLRQLDADWRGEDGAVAFVSGTHRRALADFHQGHVDTLAALPAQVPWLLELLFEFLAGRDRVHAGTSCARGVRALRCICR